MMNPPPPPQPPGVGIRGMREVEQEQDEHHAARGGHAHSRGAGPLHLPHLRAC
jgi:hypothetical protein